MNCTAMSGLVTTGLEPVHCAAEWSGLGAMVEDCLTQSGICGSVCKRKSLLKRLPTYWRLYTPPKEKEELCLCSSKYLFLVPLLQLPAQYTPKVMAFYGSSLSPSSLNISLLWWHLLGKQMSPAPEGLDCHLWRKLQLTAVKPGMCDDFFSIVRRGRWFSDRGIWFTCRKSHILFPVCPI